MPGKNPILNAGIAAVVAAFFSLATPAPASQPDESGLDKAGLKAGIASRVESIIAQQQAGGQTSQPVTEQNVRLKRVEPVTVPVGDQELLLYAVKAEITFSEEGAADDIMLVVDRTGRMEVSLNEVDTGKSPFQAVQDKLQKKKIDPELGETVLSGPGDHELVMVSDPFCPYCRTAFEFFEQNTDSISEWRVLHMTYKERPAANSAVWALADGKDVVDRQELLRFAYGELEMPTSGSTQERSEGVIGQFMEKFSKLKDKWGTAEQARYYLKGKYAEKTLQASQEAAQNLRIEATPMVYINGVPVTGWDSARYADLLNIEEEKEEKHYGQR